MNEKNIIFHIGLSKCASRFLQKQVFPKIGLYSNIAFAPDIEKYYLYHNKFDQDIYKNLVNKHIINEESTFQNLIISCEDYSELVFRGFQDTFVKWVNLDPRDYTFSNKQVIENLSKAYPDASILIILREQISWAISRYKMNYRGGKTRSGIEEYISEPMEGYDELVKRYQDTFGKSNVLVLPYELLNMNQSGFISEICEFTEHSEKPDISYKKENIAPGSNGIVEYESFKNRLRHKIKKLDLNPAIRKVLMIICRILIGLCFPYFMIRYGNKKYEISVSKNTLTKLTPFLVKTNSRLENLTGLKLKKYGYLTDS